MKLMFSVFCFRRSCTALLALYGSFALGSLAVASGGGNGSGGGSGGKNRNPFAGLSLKVLNETAPAGGMVQMKVTVTEPTPITTGSGKVSFDGDCFADINGIALFSPNGDVSGAAVVQNGQMQLRIVSPGGTFGTGLDYPILVTAVRVRPDVLPGQTSTLALDPNASWMADALGNVYAQEIKAGTFTVAGSVSITDIIPGGASLPAGATVTIQGVGFTPKSTVRLKNVNIRETRFISANRLDVVIASPAVMHGQSVEVTNPDGTSSLYYSYLRATPLGASARPLLAATVPVFSSKSYSGADFLLPVSSSVSGVFAGLSLQNPGTNPANVVVSLRAADGTELARTLLLLLPGNKIVRDSSEWLPGVTAPANSFWHVESDQPVQMLGLAGDEHSGVVQPVAPFRATP